MNGPTISSLVTSPTLGFCCEWAFLTAYRGKPTLIATRLGVSKRAVVYRFRLLAEGKLVCPGKTGCLASRLAITVPDQVNLGPNKARISEGCWHS